MGQKLYEYFIKAGELGGINARTKLSSMTKIPSMQAKICDDSPELIANFELAMETIYKEFSTSNPIVAQNDPIYSDSHKVKLLRNHIGVLSELLSGRKDFKYDVELAFHRITETLAEAINVQRASLWFYDDQKSFIECVDLYEKYSNKHSSGLKLSKSDFPKYFDALSTEKTIAAENAHTSPATMEFSKNYLSPLGIGAMLDVPLWVNDRMHGVLCHEHVGESRIWTADEENFAYLAANITSMIIECYRR